MRDAADPLLSWLTDLEARHLAERTFPEVRRALQALSSLYVERRRKLVEGAAFDGAGKRAAFALYYGPLHFLLVREIVRALGAVARAPRTVVDLGCGTAAAGAAWALEAGGADVVGVDVNGWALEEARRTVRRLGLSGTFRRGEATQPPHEGPEVGIVAAFFVNELPPPARERLLGRLLEAARAGSRILVVEPVAKGPIPWWGSWAEAFRAAGGRDDLWRFRLALPEMLVRFDRAAGLDHRELTGRSLWIPGREPG
jgi:SAM-dependent methyltransferase